ncbi:MAG: 30S ribosomal protein S8 [Chloroflexi bacterium]|nr:MAG: 30S ribosomal protein S8 [Chloroflexota bacterium]
MLSDPIADMLTRIRNAVMVGHASVAIPHSHIKAAVAEILKEEGYVEDVTIGDETPVKMIHVKLKYWGKRRERRPVINNLKRVSKPGRRVYVAKDDIPWVMSGMGISILTTPHGVMTGQKARRQGIGGEVICYVW